MTTRAIHRPAPIRGGLKGVIATLGESVAGTGWGGCGSEVAEAGEGVDLGQGLVNQADLDAIAAELSGRPRQTLGWITP